jgi:hypothetical protein
MAPLQIVKGLVLSKAICHQADVATERLAYRAGLQTLATASAFFIAATASAPVISTVVLADLRAPSAAMASAMAAMLSLFGTSAMMARS